MPFLGRDTETAALDAALHTLKEGAGGFALVAGEPGIGKTRLLEEAETRAQARGHTVLRGHAAEFERDLPFSVFVDALDAYLMALEPSRLARMGVSRLAELGTMLPSLAEHAPAGAVQAADRWRAHRAMRELLDGLAGTRGLVLLLDDLHWADEASLELLGALVRRPPAGAVLVVAATRPQGCVAVLRGAVVRAAETGGATLIEPGPLSDADAEQLLGSDAPLPAGTRAQLVHEAGGNPFYLEQLARAPARAAAASAGADAEVLEGGFRVPGAVAASLTEELRALSDDVRLLIQGAAVAGDPFEIRLAAGIVAMDFGAALSRVDEAQAAGLVRPADVPGWYRFRHPLVRRAVYEAAPDGWRLHAHERAAQLLGERGDGPVARAHHVERSAQPGDLDAVALLEAAAEQAAGRAPASAATWLGAALRLVPEPDTARQRAILARLADAALAAGHLEQSHAAILEAERLALDVGGLTVEDTLVLAEAETWLGDADAMRRRLAAARSAAADDPRSLALLELRLMLQNLWEAEREEAFVNGQRALAAAEAAGDPVTLARVRAVLADVASHVDSATARALYEQAAEAVSTFADVEVSRGMEALYSLGWAAVHLERYEDALRHFERGIDVGLSTGVHRFAVTLTSERAEPLIRLGRVREAIVAAEEGVEAARLHPSPRFLWWAAWLQSAVFSRAGDLDAAEEAYRESERQAQMLPRQVVVQTWMTYQKAQMLSQRGLHDEALSVLYDGCGGPDLPTIPPNDRQSAWHIIVDASLAAGDLGAAEKTVAEAEAWAALSALSGLAGHASRLRSRLAAAAGDHEAAVAAAERSAGGFLAIGSELDAERSRVAGALSLAALGRKGVAVEVLARAEERFAAIGAEFDRAGAARELRRLGRRTKPKPGGAGGGAGAGLPGLSGREREVAQLVHERRTNKEIADALFLSEKTVESHLRNIFVKLGVTSRLEVAVAVERARSDVTG